MNPQIRHFLPLLALWTLTGCAVTKEGVQVTAAQSRDTSAVLHVVAATAKEFNLGPIIVDDTNGPKVLCAYARYNGSRIIVTRADPSHLMVSTNAYHESDADNPNQAEVRRALEARLRAVFPATSIKVQTGYPTARWVLEAN